MSVGDVSGKAIANLATEDLKHPAPVFHGDTLFCESEVLEVTPSRSKPDRGVVKVHTKVFKQDNTLVAEFKRAVLVPRKNPGERRPTRRKVRYCLLLTGDTVGAWTASTMEVSPGMRLSASSRS